MFLPNKVGKREFITPREKRVPKVRNVMDCWSHGEKISVRGGGSVAWARMCSVGGLVMLVFYLKTIEKTTESFKSRK